MRHVTYLLLISLLMIACEPIQIVRELPPDQQTPELASPTPLPPPSSTSVVTPTPLPTLPPTPTYTPTPLPVYNAPAIEVARFGQGILHDVTLSPQGDMVAVATSIGIWLYDTATWQPLRFIDTHSSQQRIIFGEDGQTLLTISDDPAIQQWQVADGALLQTIKMDSAQPINEIALSPDGWSVASGGFDGQVRLWGLADQVQQQALTLAEKGWVQTVTYAPDGRLYFGGSTPQLHRWDGQTDQIVREHSNQITSSAISADGQWLASASADGTVQLGPPESVSQTIPTGNLVTALAFSPDSTMVAIGGQDGQIRLWDIATGQLSRTIPAHQALISRLIFLSPSQLLSVGRDNQIQVWQLPQGTLSQTIATFSHPMTSVDLSPDGQLVISGDTAGGIHVWRVADQIKQYNLNHAAAVSVVAFSPDGSVFASAGLDGTVRFWRSSDGVSLIDIPQTEAIYSLAFSPTGDRFAVGLADYTAQLWRVFDQQKINTFTGFDSEVTSVQFWPDGEALGASGQQATLHQLSDGTILQQITMTNAETKLAFSFDGLYVALSEGETLHVRSGAEWGSSVSMGQRHQQPITDLAFAHTNYNLLSSSEDHEVFLWHGENGQLLQLFSGHTAKVNSVTFSTDDRTIASASHDGTVRLWQAP